MARPRYRGWTTGAPASGTHSTGDWKTDYACALWICTAGGTPGTWLQFGRIIVTTFGGLVAAAAANKGLFAWVTDINGGTLYLSDGSAWNQAAGSGDLDSNAAGGAIKRLIVDAKGDLVTATTADTPARLAVGANGTFLTAQSGQATGLQWATHDSTGDPHTQLTLLAGRAGGQTLIGGTASGDDLVLESTSHATKGTIDLRNPVKLLVDNATYTATLIPFQISSTITLDHVNAAFVGFYHFGTVIYEQAGSLTAGGTLVRNSATFKNPAGEANNLGAHFLFNSQGVYQADTQSILLTAFIGLNAAEVFNVASGGTLTVSAYDSVRSGATVSTGATVTAYNGLRVLNPGGAGTITTLCGVDIEQLTRGTTSIGIRNAATTVYTPPAVQSITAVTQAITVASTLKMIDANASYTLTSAPTIANGVDGQVVTIINTDSTDVVTLQDQGTLASSNLRLGATTRALGPRDSITLVYSSTVGDWVELSYNTVI